AMKEGRYLYCVANVKEKTSLGNIGIEDSEVYTVPFQDIAAVVHCCDVHPYETSEEEKAKEWILAHLYTIDEAMKRFGTPLPFRFDTIIKGGDDEVAGWLRKEYRRLKGALDEVREKAEYGVQIFWDRDLVAEKVRERRGMEKLERGIEERPGMAYMLKRKMEKRLKDELTVEAEERRKEFYERISACVAKIKVEKAKAESKSLKGKEMLLNLSCLADRAQVEELGKVLDGINAMRGIEVHFTGPWPPFNLAGGGEHEAQ
ncbi:MAG: GvpL/GvpF family gas vesicle protein, partial [Candidatus Hydrothermarchaeota archaeon]|nr:GvpL/GvpF family gas vesicle protein [Candidatus Hydrothermarchaeota archaeon]